MTGTLLAATFSYGCDRANQLGITPMLKEYAESEGKSYSEKEIQEYLKKLYSYFYYQTIARANGIEDPFSVEVVYAHWIGNFLLEEVKPIHAASVFEEAREKGHDRIILAVALHPLARKGLAHHNDYAEYFDFLSEENPKRRGKYIDYYAGMKDCKVTTDGKDLYHLGIKRIPVTPKDIENLKKYGSK